MKNRDGDNGGGGGDYNRLLDGVGRIRGLGGGVAPSHTPCLEQGEEGGQTFKHF